MASRSDTCLAVLNAPGATPYASLLPRSEEVAAALADTVDKMEQVRTLRFRAAKLEAVEPTFPDDTAVIEAICQSRGALGADRALLVDVGYRWTDAKAVLRVLKEIEDCHLYLLETPLPFDDLDGYARLADASDVRIAAGEWLTTRFEFVDLMDRGHADVVQPDVARVGGFTEAMRVARLARDRGRLVIPHAWKTGLPLPLQSTSAPWSATAPTSTISPRRSTRPSCGGIWSARNWRPSREGSNSPTDPAPAPRSTTKRSTAFG